MNTEAEVGSDRSETFELGGTISAAKSGNCQNEEPIVDSVRPATISRLAGVRLTIEGCNLAPKAESSKIETDLTKYAIFFVSGSDQVRCNVIHYYTTNEQIICETEAFPHDGDFFVKVFANGKEVGANGYGKTCKICRIRAYSNFNSLIKQIEPSNIGKNGDVIEIKGRIFTDAYEEDRCAFDDDDEECNQEFNVEEGSNYLLGQPKFVDRLGKDLELFLFYVKIFPSLIDTSEDSKLVLRRIYTKVDASIFFSFFRRVRATSRKSPRPL